jgi:hypothetical protein
MGTKCSPFLDDSFLYSHEAGFYTKRKIKPLVVVFNFTFRYVDSVGPTEIEIESS